MNKFFARLLIGSLVTLSLALILTTGVNAASLGQDEPPEPAAPDCRECHWDIYLTWEQSAHGRGLSCGQCHLADQDNHARQGHGAQGGAQECMDCHTTGYDASTDTWEEDDIHCSACHTPIATNHPDEPMPTDRSDALCGQCHIQAHFEWQASKHGQAGVVCVACHNQHATSLKDKSVSEECEHCHGERVVGFSHSGHSDEGLSCADCHLAPLDNPLGEGNAKRDHSFDVELETCTACHAYQLHNGTETAEEQHDVQLASATELDAMSSSMTAEVTAEPAPVNPFFLAMVTGGLGLAAGTVVTVGAAQLYRRTRKEKEDGE